MYKCRIQLIGLEREILFTLLSVCQSRIALCSPSCLLVARSDLQGVKIIRLDGTAQRIVAHTRIEIRLPKFEFVILDFDENKIEIFATPQRLFVRGAEALIDVNTTLVGILLAASWTYLLSNSEVRLSVVKHDFGDYRLSVCHKVCQVLANNALS